MIPTAYHTTAPAPANVVLALELAMGMALTFGAWLAHRKRYKLHAWCQSLIVLLNLAVIALAMAPSFSATVRPKLPQKLNHSFYSLATTHAFLATVTELAALYLILSAGTNVLPARFRISNLKSAMRTVFALWWLVLLLGIATYVRWYVPLKHG